MKRKPAQYQPPAIAVHDVLRLGIGPKSTYHKIIDITHTQAVVTPALRGAPTSSEVIPLRVLYAIVERHGAKAMRGSLYDAARSDMLAHDDDPRFLHEWITIHERIAQSTNGQVRINNA